MLTESTHTKKRPKQLFWRIARVFLYIAIFISLERFCYKQTRGFRLYRISSDLPFHSEWATPKPDSATQEQLQTVFSQTYSYLGDGGQSYCFLSEDGSTVIKFFKFHHMGVPSLFKAIPLPKSLSSMRDKYAKKCEAKLPKVFTSCKIAFDEFKDETGLIYIHLNKTDYLHTSLTIKDRLGISHLIDLDKTEFAVQKKADLNFMHLRKKLASTSKEEVKTLMDSILNFVYQRSKKGIKDNDCALQRNFGFINDKLIEIDIGSFSKTDDLNDPSRLESELRMKTHYIYAICSDKYPDLLADYEQKIQELCYHDQTSAL